MTQCNCKNTDELRIVRGNAFAIRLTVSAIHIDGTPVENFVLGDSEAVLKVMHLDGKTPKDFLVIGNDAIINFGGDLSLGWYGFEMTGTFNGKPWRWCLTQVFQVVETNAKANIPAWAALTDETYSITGVMTITSGDIYQSDWNETNHQSPLYIKNKPDVVLHPEFNKTVQRIDRDIAAEETRAKGAEQTLQEHIDAEALARGNADTTLQENIDAEERDRKAADVTLQQNIDAEALARGNADTTLQGNIDAEETRAKAAETQNADNIDTIEGMIPQQASSQNQLADKNFVNSSVATNTAYYISDNGQPFTSMADLEAYSGQLTNNDYAFVVGTDQAGNTTYTRYKYNADTEQWADEYVLNNSSFTAEQWAAISSGITSGDVAKLDALPTKAQLDLLLGGKQDTISDLQTIREGAAAGATAYQKPSGGIPKSDMSQGVQDSLSRADEAVVANGSGTSGQVLTSKGSGQEPGWQTGELVHPVTNVSGTAAVTTSGHYYSVKWMGQCEGVTALRDGMMVNIKIPVQGNSTYHTVLNINGLGEHPVCRNVTTDADAYVADSIITLIYDANAQAPAYLDSGTATTVTGVWKIGDFDSVNTFQLRHNAGTYVALTALPSKVICLQKNETTLIPVNATGEIAFSKVLTTESFNPFGAIVYVNDSYAANAAIDPSKIYEQFVADFRISFNTGTNLTANKDVYICAVPQSDGMAKLDATTPIVQELPSTDDGKIYIYVGHASSNRNVEIYPVHPVYWFKGGKVVPYTVLDISAKADKSYVDGKFLSKCIDITYADLKSLRDNSGLNPGQWYRITDYVTTTAQADTQSAGHQFDVIVMAPDAAHLSETAFAAQHSGDTYFNGAQLEAWELRYCLDNDTDRFAWADNTNGKGVIYWMKDQTGNECPYDFKNIQFMRRPLTGRSGLVMDASYVQESTYDAEAVRAMATIAIQLGSSMSASNYGYWHSMGIGKAVLGSTLTSSYVDYQGNAATIDAEAYYMPMYNVNNNVIYCKCSDAIYVFTFYYRDGGLDLSLTDKNINNNIIRPYFNSGKRTLNNIVFMIYSTSTYPVYGNSFGFNCYNNTFSQNTYINTFGNNVHRNTFGNNMYYNTLGNNVRYNTFGDSMQANTFGNNVQYNTFGNNVQYNTFGNSVIYNTFGNYAQYNTFGNGVGYNTFAGNVHRNTFGNNVRYNTFGNSVQYNTFGNGVQHVVYGQSVMSLGSYFYKNIIENGNQYLLIDCTQTTSSSAKCQNIKVSQGVNNTTTQKTLTVDVVEQQYQITFQAAASEIRNV